MKKIGITLFTLFIQSHTLSAHVNNKNIPATTTSLIINRYERNAGMSIACLDVFLLVFEDTDLDVVNIFYDIINLFVKTKRYALLQ